MSTEICGCVAILFAFVVTESVVQAQAGRSYPLVHGATGRPYGPTQSHYQYQRRYGRPWTGNGSTRHNNHHHDHGHHHGPVTSFRSPWVDPFWGANYYGGVPIYSPVPVFGYQGVIPGVPSVSTSQYYYERQGFGPVFSGTVVPTPFDRGYSDVLPPRPNEIAPFGFNAPSLTPNRPLIPPSSPAAQVQALHSMARGDLKLAQMNYLGAADHYRDAIRSARDLAEPRYRLAITHTARTKFQDAVEEFKLAFAVNPDWLNERQSLDQLFGVDNLLGKTEIKHRVADWLLRDSRDPNRLFLLAMMLHLDNDPRAITLVDTAILVAGREPYMLTLKESIAKEAPLQPAVPPQPGLVPNEPKGVPMNHPPAPQAQPPVQDGPKLPSLQAP